MVMLAGGALEANADETPSVYDTPGAQISDGRLWNTTCEDYSSNVVRCRAEIWATTVEYVDGRYVKKTGWTFNNLSYLPSPRAAWANNNLGRTNDNWTSDGRQWRTECDTAATGRGACRSYAMVDVVKPSGGSYVNQKEWVFNNVVLFSTASIPAVREVPGWIIDQSRLSFTGLGPLQLGTPMKDLETLGYVRDVFNICQFWPSSQSLLNRGIYVQHNLDLAVPQRASEITVAQRGIRTTAGAQVGMSLADIRAIYGDAVTLDTKQGIPEKLFTAVVRQGANELVFISSHELTRPLRDTDVITEIVAREYSTSLGNVC